MPAIPPSVPLLDGWSTLYGGMDASRYPRLIDRNQFASGINVTARGGWPKTRPAWTYKTLIFRNDENEEWFKTQIYQGGCIYTYVGFNQTLGQAKEIFVCSVGGRIWQIDKCTFEVLEITPGGRAGRNSRCNNKAYFCQAEQWLVIQDGQSRPILFDGGLCRRSNPVKGEIPVMTAMAYGQGRIWGIQGPRLLAGDLVGSYPNAVIGFRETTFLATNGVIYPSYTVGNMTGLQFIPQQDTATGIGSLLVLGENGIASVFAEKERSQWVTGIARVTLINTGGTGHRAVTSINGDVWFEAKDGWRSYRHARGEVDKWYQLPMSLEVTPYPQTSANFLKPFTSCIFFDNRLLATTGPITQNGRISFKGMIVLDFHVLSSFGDEITKPAWDGLWTGVNILELIKGKDTAWAFGIDESGSTSLYELSSEVHTPVNDTSLVGERPIECQLVSGSYVFDNGNRASAVGAQAEKELKGGDAWVRDLVGRATVQTYYRRDGEKCFQFWKDFSICANDDLCDSGCAMTAKIPQYRNRLKFGNPKYTAVDCSTLPKNPTNPGKLYIGYEFQEKITWTGRLTLSLSRIQALVDMKEPDLGPCDPDEPACSTMENCCYDPYSFTPKFPYYTLPPFPPANPGCTDPKAMNYDPLADPGDGSCIYPTPGCTDSGAFNYNPDANVDDGSCVPIIYGCTESGSSNFDPLANTDDGSCIGCVYGCTNSSDPNYDPEATCDDGSCEGESHAGCAPYSLPVEIPPEQVPAMADGDTQLTLYKTILNTTPVGGYMIQDFVGYGLGMDHSSYSIIGNGAAPTKLGTKWYASSSNTWYAYNPQPGIGSEEIYRVNFYTFGYTVAILGWEFSNPVGHQAYGFLDCWGDTFDPGDPCPCG